MFACFLGAFEILENTDPFLEVVLNPQMGAGTHHSLIASTVECSAM